MERFHDTNWKLELQWKEFLLIQYMYQLDNSFVISGYNVLDEFLIENGKGNTVS